MKALRLCLILAVACIIPISSCKKDKEEVKTNTDLLTQHTWKMSAVTVDPSFPILNDQGEIIGYTNDLYSQLPDCSKDDTQKYNSNGSYIYDEGDTKCSPDDPQTSTGSWVFNPSETTITETDSQGDTFSYDVIELNDNTLKVSYSFQDGSVTYTFTVTFKPV